MEHAQPGELRHGESLDDGHDSANGMGLPGLGPPTCPSPRSAPRSGRFQKGPTTEPVGPSLERGCVRSRRDDSLKSLRKGAFCKRSLIHQSRSRRHTRGRAHPIPNLTDGPAEESVLAAVPPYVRPYAHDLFAQFVCA